MADLDLMKNRFSPLIEKRKRIMRDSFWDGFVEVMPVLDGNWGPGTAITYSGWELVQFISSANIIGIHQDIETGLMRLGKISIKFTCYGFLLSL